MVVQVDFGQKLKHLFLPESVSPWFMLDCKLGSLMLGLEPPGCFGADLYAADLGITDPDNDQRFNYGEHLLRAALMFWSTRWAPCRMSNMGRVPTFGHLTGQQIGSDQLSLTHSYGFRLCCMDHCAQLGHLTGQRNGLCQLCLTYRGVLHRWA